MIRRTLLLSLVAVAATFAAKPAATDPLASFRAQDRTLQDMLHRFPKATLSSNDSLKKHLNSMFGFAELGKRALGKTWDKQSKADQDSFLVYFSRMVLKKSLESPQDYISDSARHVLVGKPTATGAVVGSTVFRGADQLKITYTLYLDGGTWRVCDLKQGEKPSQLDLYRDQFTKYLAKTSKKTFADLLVSIRKKAGA